MGTQMQLRMSGVLKEELVASTYTVLTYVVCGERVPAPGIPVLATVPLPEAGAAAAQQPAPRKRRRTATATATAPNSSSQ